MGGFLLPLLTLWSTSLQRRAVPSAGVGLRSRKWLESRCLEGAHRPRGRLLDVGDRFWGHFDDVKAKVEYTALVSVDVDPETP